jgi:hypothetical protein
MSNHKTFERSYRDTTPVNGVKTKEMSCSTKIGRVHGDITINCDLCGISYETYACWAKRTNNHYCSKACTSAAKEFKIKKACIVCGTEFDVTLTQAKRICTCSRKCLKKRRSDLLIDQAKNIEASPIFNYGDHERGEKISKKLDDNKIRLIRSDKRSQRLIAEDFRISQSMVSSIKAKKSWAHVDDA